MSCQPLSWLPSTEAQAHGLLHVPPMHQSRGGEDGGQREPHLSGGTLCTAPGLRSPVLFPPQGFVRLSHAPLHTVHQHVLGMDGDLCH